MSQKQKKKLEPPPIFIFFLGGRPLGWVVMVMALLGSFVWYRMSLSILPGPSAIFDQTWKRARQK